MTTLQKEIAAIADACGYTVKPGEDNTWQKPGRTGHAAEIYTHNKDLTSVNVLSFGYVEWTVTFTNTTPPDVYREILTRAAAHAA